MTAQCMGNFGCHKLLYPHYFNDAPHERYRLIKYSPLEHQRLQEGCRDSYAERIDGDSEETVWVNKRYIPTDLRSTAPVPRHKLIAPKRLSLANKHWVPSGEPSPKSVSRSPEERQVYVSSTSTRSEDWSTLRQILPSKGRPDLQRPPNWGTAISCPPTMIPIKQSRFPHINSPMTRYTDDMHLTNRLFKLH